MKCLRAIALALLSVSLAAAPLRGQAAPGGEPVVIGALYNLTGSQANLDVPSANGAQLAVDEVNQAGGVLGRQVKLALEDGQSDPKVLAEKTGHILTQHPGVAGFIGLSDTDMVLGAAPVAAAAKRVFVTSGATAPELVSKVPDYLFLACFGDNVQAAAAAEWAYNAREARALAFLVDPSMTYTKGLAEFCGKHFEKLGGRSITAPPVAPNELNLPNLGSKVRWTLPMAFTGADFVYAAYGPEAALTAVRRIRADDIIEPILGGDSFDIPEVWAANPEVKDVIFTTHAFLGEDNPDPAVAAFRKAYQAKFGKEPDAFSALGYDAARLLLHAITKAGSTDPEAIRSALAATADFPGITGKISYTAGNRIPTKSVTIMEVAGGKIKFVTQVTPGQPAQ